MVKYTGSFAAGRACFKQLFKVGGAVVMFAWLSVAQAGQLPLSGNDATGYMAQIGFQAEVNASDGSVCTDCINKGYGYPWYWDAANSVWQIIAAEPLSAATVYPQEGSFSVINKTVTDADFNQFDVGAIQWDDIQAGLTGSGVEVIPVSLLSIIIDETEFSPYLTPAADPTFRNVNNEFAWTHPIVISNLSGTGITLNNGTVTSVDIVADVAVNVALLGTLPWSWNTPSGTLDQVGALQISGNTMTFSFDQTESGSNAFGAFDAVRIILNRAGSFDLNNAELAFDVSVPMLPPLALLLLASGLIATRFWRLKV